MDIRGMLRAVYWHSIEGAGDGPFASLAAFCPACDFEHNFNVDLEGHGRWPATSPVWTFDGNYEAPTFSPSMLANKDRADSHKPVCHSWVKAGQWEYLDDCTHDKAGQTLPMIPPVEDMTFQRRHGWHLYPWTDAEGNPLPEGEAKT